MMTCDEQSCSNEAERCLVISTPALPDPGMDRSEVHLHLCIQHAADGALRVMILGPLWDEHVTNYQRLELCEEVKLMAKDPGQEAARVAAEAERVKREQQAAAQAARDAAARAAAQRAAAEAEAARRLAAEAARRARKTDQQ